MNGNLYYCVHLKRISFPQTIFSSKVKVIFFKFMPGNNRIDCTFRMLEPCEVKVSCTVLRGERESNLPYLLDTLRGKC